MSNAALIIDIAGWWLIAGAIIAALFLTIGMDRIDEDARGAYMFRPLLIPGVMLIWPLVLWRWLRLEQGEDNWLKRYQPPRAVHLKVAVFLAMAIGLLILAGLSIRQEWPADLAPVQLEEPAS